MKRIISLLLTLFMVGTITACNNPVDTKVEYLDWVYVREQTTRGAVSDQGYYYLDGSILSYVDFASGLSVALCSRAGCKHKEYDCDAYIGGGYAFTPMYFENDRIYYADGGTIYRRNATGIEYAEVGVIGKKYLEERKGVEPQKFAVTGDYLYYLADIQEITSEGSTTTVIATMQTIGRVNLNTGKDELLVEEALDRDSEKLLLCAVCKNGIIYHHWEGVEKGMSYEPIGFCECPNMLMSPPSLYSPVHLSEFCIRLVRSSAFDMIISSAKEDTQSASAVSTVANKNVRILTFFIIFSNII